MYRTVVHLRVPGQQILHHVGLVGDEVVHAQLQHVGGDLFAVDGPGRDGLAPVSYTHLDVYKRQLPGG